jgi:hypothetical protein
MEDVESDDSPKVISLQAFAFAFSRSDAFATKNATHAEKLRPFRRASRRPFLMTSGGSVILIATFLSRTDRRLAGMTIICAYIHGRINIDSGSRSTVDLDPAAVDAGRAVDLLGPRPCRA